MSIEVALIDFPRLQEQIATRLLAEHHVNVSKITHLEAESRLNMFNLALFFWPDSCSDAALRLQKMKHESHGEHVPVVLVTNEAGKLSAESNISPEGATDVLVTPLQPHIVSRKLAKLLGISKNHDETKLDAAYITPFVDGTVETLTQMAGMECIRTGLSLRMDAVTKGDISGTMGLSGAAEGFVSVTFRNDLARKIVCRMLQIQIGEETEEDIRDGVGEFMNMVAGAAKAELRDTPHSFSLSLPNVIVGGPHSVGQLRGVPVIVIEFETEGEPFEVMVCLIPRHTV
jgi:chemotaxis protein CheX